MKKLSKTLKDCFETLYGQILESKKALCKFRKEMNNENVELKKQVKDL